MSGNGFACVLGLCTFLSQCMGNKQVHHEGIIFIGIKHFRDEFQLVFIERQELASKILICFPIHVAVIFVWDDCGDCSYKNKL